MRFLGLCLLFLTPTVAGVSYAAGVERQLAQGKALLFTLRFLKEYAILQARPFPEVYMALSRRREIAALSACGFMGTLLRTGSLQAALRQCDALEEPERQIFSEFADLTGNSSKQLSEGCVSCERKLMVRLDEIEKTVTQRKKSAITLGLCGGSLLVLLLW